MAYIYEGVRKIAFQDVQVVHSRKTLVGYLKLYPDNIESYIDEGYSWTEIMRHIDCGGEIGYEF